MIIQRKVLLQNKFRRMGCSQSKLDSYGNQTYISIIDPGFLKPANEAIRNSLKQNNILATSYMSVSCFIDDQKASYSKNVVVRQQEMEQLLQTLSSIKSKPSLFVLKKNKLEMKNGQPQKRITFIDNYEGLLKHLTTTKTQHIRKTPEKGKVDVRILKGSDNGNEPQLFIFEETLKVKGISYKIYKRFQAFQEDVELVDSPVMVTDYVFQRQVVTLLAKKKTKIICYCNLDNSQSYHPSISFITNNFQEIVNEIGILKGFSHPPLATTKVFLCSTNKRFFRYKSTLEDFQVQTRCFKEVIDILKTTKYYLSLIVLCPDEEKTKIDEEVAAEGLTFRVQVLGIMEDTQNTPVGLRKVLREVKRGYLVEKGVCKMVDIIDKYHNSSKYEDVKKQLASKQIRYRCFDDFTAFAKNQIYCAPIIICSYSERQILSRFLDNAKYRAKIIIFCNKNKITTSLAQEKWAYFSNYFTKILNYITTNKILVPVILDHNQKRIELKQQKIKQKQHRISALKWAGPSLNINNVNMDIKVKNKTCESNTSFIVPKINVNSLQVKQICHDASALLKMPYQPTKRMQDFQKNLKNSLLFLKDRYKLSFPEQAFNQLLQNLKAQSLQTLAIRARQFFGAQKQMGLKINQSLKKLESLDEKELKHIREILYLLNLNFVTMLQMPRVRTVRLVHWTKQPLLEQSLPEGVVIFKNFLVMYEQGTTDCVPGCLKLQLQLQYNTLTDTNLPISSYFQFEGRYVFAPYTQFKIKCQEGENQSIATLQLVKSPDFLNYYLESNLSNNLPDYFTEDMAKEGSLVSRQERQKVMNNITRCANLKLYKTGVFEKACQQQNQLLSREEEAQNIDHRYLNELLFQLCHYQFKSNQIDDFLATVEEVINNDPEPLIKKECSSLLSKIKKQISKEKIVQDPVQVHQTKERTQKCIELKETIEKAHNYSSDESEELQSGDNEENNIFEHEQCLQINQTFASYEHFE